MSSAILSGKSPLEIAEVSRGNFRRRPLARGAGRHEPGRSASFMVATRAVPSADFALSIAATSRPT